mgnify:CR=1 FL=1
MADKAADTKPRIGFIGMGLMGSRMATRLLEAGYPLTVYNRTKDKARPLAQRGASVADTPKELATRSDVVISVLSDDAAVKSALTDPDGAIAGASRGTLLIDSSTVYPGTSRQVHKAAGARGIDMVDAAISGSTPQAEQGALLFFVGGEPDAYQRAKPILEVMGKQAFHMGPSGAGTTMKLVVNTLLGVGLQAIAEAIAFGQNAGLDRERLLEVLGQTPLIAVAHRSKLDNARRGEYPVNFELGMMYKDFGLILRQAAELAVPMPATAVAQQMCAAERAKGLEEDYSATIRLMEQLAGLPKR